MEVLMACSELAPIVKCGVLADAVAALAKTLSRLEHKVTVAMPKYPVVANAGLMMARRLTPIRFMVGETKMEATLFDARLGSGVELLLIDLPELFDSDEIYTGDERDAKRFGLFSRAVAELVRMRGEAGTGFDAVHAHDWPTALVPFLLSARAGSPGLDVRTVLTIHDAANQGRFPKEAVDTIGLSWDDFHPGALEFYGDLNMVKAGVLTSDVVTTVSPTYARELSSGAAASGLDGVFQSRGDDFVGILNGIDYARWSPGTDPHLPSHYDSEAVANKGRCKAALLHELDMSLDPERPLIVTVGPVDERHGADVLARSIAGIVRTGARIVIAGTGDQALEHVLEDAAQTAGEDAAFLGAVSEPMQHRLIAAADAVLICSRREPCGIVQQYAERYGALPIAHAVGGLVDTVVDCDAALETGTGFLFEEVTADAVVGAVQRAVSAMTKPEWGALRRRVMRLDHSWESPARRYARLYAQ